MESCIVAIARGARLACRHRVLPVRHRIGLGCLPAARAFSGTSITQAAQASSCAVHSAQAIPTSPDVAEAFWDKVADAYDGAYFEYFCTQSAKTLVDEADLLGLSSAVGGEQHVTLVDVGSGTGNLALACARILPGARVLASDLSSHMVNDIKRKADESPRTYGNVTAFQADATDLSMITSDAAEAVFSNQALQFVPDQQTALQEMFRILCPGGQVFISSWAPLSMCPAIDMAYRALERVQEAKAVRVGREFVPFRHQPNANFSLSDRQALADQMAAVGFKNVQVRMAKATYSRASMAELVGMAMQQFGPGVDDDELEVFVESFREVAAEVVKQDRVFAMFNVATAMKE